MDPELELALAMSLSLAAQQEQEEEERKRRKQEEERKQQQRRQRREVAALRHAQQQREDEEEKQLQLLLDEELAQAVAAVENEDVYRCDAVLAQEATESAWPQNREVARPPPALCRDDSDLAVQLAKQLNSEVLELDEAVARAVEAERVAAAPAPLRPPLPSPRHRTIARFAPSQDLPATPSDFVDLESMTPEQLAAFTERLQDVPRAVPTSALARLPEEAVTRAVQGENCLICLLDFEVGDTVRRLPCLHRFHKHCVDTWFQQRNVCPECRTEISRETIP